jgi:hypothetical protein
MSSFVNQFITVDGATSKKGSIPQNNTSRTQVTILQGHALKKRQYCRPYEASSSMERNIVMEKCIAKTWI